MNNFLKRFVAFAIAAVMICGMLPVSAMAVETHDHSDHSDIQPFTSTEALIEQVKAQLAAQGETYAEETVDQALVQAVERESAYSYNQAETQLVQGFFNNRTGTEGQISTAHLNLDEATMTALVESTLKAFYLDGIVEVAYVVEAGIVTALTFTMRDSFAAGLDEIAFGLAENEEESTEAPVQTAEAGEVAQTANTDTAEEEKPFPFTDIPEKHWARTAVNYLYQRGIVSGVSATKYGASVNVTRGQAVMMIWRAVDSPKPAGKNTFTDVKSSDYYVDAVVWAAENGIVSGTGNGKFSPSNNITREQLIAIMYKLAQFMGLDVSEKASLSGFKDAGKIAKYAQEAVKWAVAAGLASGYEDGTFRPQGTATRAEYAQVLYKYLLNAHTLVKVEAVASTCSTKGNIEHWKCSKCGKLFADEKGKKELTQADVELPLDRYVHNPVPVPEVSPTCTATGVAAHYKCACGLIVDTNGNVVTDMKTLTLAPTGHYPAADSKATVWNWERVVSYYYNTDANGNPTFNQGLTDAEGNPIPDFPVDENGNMICTLYFDSETGAISVGYQEIVTWECDSMTYVCQGCNQEFEAETTVSSYVMTEAWLEETVNAYAQEVATELITEYVTEKAMAYYAETGSAPTEAMQNQWVAEAQQDAALMGQVTQAANMKAMELAQNLDSTIYVATTADKAELLKKNAETGAMEKTGTVEAMVVQTNEQNATVDLLQRDWATMCAFNAYYSNYFGLVAPYWASKNTEASPLGAVIYMCSQEEQDLIPNSYLDMMVSMLTQAFMSYVYSYGDLLDGMLEQAMAVVNYEELDEIDKLLLLHDWLAKYGTFDMQSLVDITSGVSTGNEPIQMTAFGVLLNDQIEKAEGSTWDGGVCLGYAATYALLVQQAFGKTQEDAAIVDFVKIQYLTGIAESSVAAEESGFGDGDAMFHSSHYLNAVNLNDTWYYIDACYDDINTEVISQYRVETDGNVSHMSFLLAPSTWEEMYEGSYQLMDSLYDGKVWQRVFDGESGYMMMDKDGNTYTKAEADALLAEAEENGEALQLFYYYEAIETSAETRYEDATYEEAWFVSANSAINYDPETQYFYYTSGAINSYATMKDMFGDSQMDSSGLEDILGDTDLSMDQADMLEYKYDPAAQDKVVRRPVGAQNEPDSGNAFSMSQATDTEAEILFHFGYGSVGAVAHEQFQADLQENSMTGDSTITDEEKGPYYNLVEEDQVYLSNYPEIAHSTVMMDGKLYFNIGNAIYTFNYSVADMAKQTIDQITTLELVKVKEYNEVTYSSNGKRFTGMSYEVSDSGETLYYHPIAALSVHNDFKNEGAETLYVSVATNLTNSYKVDDESYVEEARNYNPDYYRFMEAEEEETTTNANTNVEFMWCANIVDKMPVEDLLADLESGETETVSVDAYCGHEAFTEVRTVAFGLSTDGVKTVEEGTAVLHDYAYDYEEETNICSVCLEAHDHSYNYEGAAIDIAWSLESITALTAEAYVYCNGDYCGVHAEADHVVVTDNGDGTFTAVATYGTLEATETMSLNQFLHPEHTYGEPVFTWTYVEETEEIAGYWTATATFTCTEGTDVCEIERDRTVVVACTVSTDANGDYIATCTGPDGETYTSDPHHTYGEVTWTWTEENGVVAATASKTCVNCDETLTAEATIKETVTKKADCYNEGEMVYDATAAFADGTTAKAQKTGVIAKTTHEFNENGVCKYCGDINETHVHDYTDVVATYTWNEGYTSCTQTYECATCNTEAGVKTTEASTISYNVTTEATCETNGVGVYIAVFADGETSSKSVVIPATGHTFTADADGVVWNYNSETGTMNATVEYTCACGDTDTETVEAVLDGEKWVATFTKHAELVAEHTHTEGTCACGYVAG